MTSVFVIVLMAIVRLALPVCLLLIVGTLIERRHAS